MPRGMPVSLLSWLMLAAVSVSLSCAGGGARTVTTAPTVASHPALLPLPAHVQWRDGRFTLSPQTVIVAPAELQDVGRLLRDYVGLGVGPAPLRLDTSVEGLRTDAIVLRLSGDARSESYVLDVSRQAVTITGGDAAGVFYGVQTLRQLLPARFEYEALRYAAGKAPVVEIPAVEIRDQPRFEWRGTMLDVARHFFSVQDVKRYVDLIALHKLNRLHLHLADDQGWRLEIKSWPNLARHGGSTEVGGGPGGYFTQDEYADLIRYAAARFITIVPEIDMPGHTNAALASYPELNCDGQAPPLYTGIEVGFSALCVESEVTYRFIDDVVREIAALTPGPYFHIGGDEVKRLSAERYAAFIERVQTIVRAHGKQAVGWDEIAAAPLADNVIVQHWRPNTSGKAAAARGARVIVSSADRAYLDMKYAADTPIGLSWAALIPVPRAYDWDPHVIVSDVPPAAVIGVEAPLWAETAATINDVEFLAFPRLAAIAEIAWTPQAARQWREFRIRLGAQAPRWRALGVNFYRAPEIPWQ
jgi:hexosaminidase